MTGAQFKALCQFRKCHNLGTLPSRAGTNITGMKFTRQAKVALLVPFMLFAWFAYAQSPAPVATYKVNARNALKGWGGPRFQWATGPDQSLLITMWEPNDQCTILRLTGWETRKPKVETLTVPVILPAHGVGSPSLREPLVDPAGKYLVIRSPEINLGENESDKQKWEAVLAVIDLRSFTLTKTVTAIGGLAGGGLYFSKGGTLMLDTMARLGGPFTLAVTALALPTLDQIGSCEYNVKFPRGSQEEWPPNSEITKASESCPAVMEAAHLTSIDELANRPAEDERTKNLAGPDCQFQESNRAKDLALYRCGKEHFTDPSGDFGITFWHALKVLSVPDGNSTLSLSLRFYDDKSSGLFAVSNGHDYLIVQRGLKLSTYRLPDRAAVKRTLR